MGKRLSVMALLLAVLALLAGGATMAYLTDVATSNGNQFSTGTVAIKAVRNHGDNAANASGEIVSGPLFYTTAEEGGVYGSTPPYSSGDVELGCFPTGYWAPGDHYSRILNVTNTGTMPIKLTKVRARVNASSNWGTNSAASLAEFTSKLNVRIEQVSVVNPPGKLLYDGPLAGLLTSGDNWVDAQEIIRYNPGAVADLTFTCRLDESALNTAQGIIPVFDFEILAEQQKNNP